MGLELSRSLDLVEALAPLPQPALICAHTDYARHPLFNCVGPAVPLSLRSSQPTRHSETHVRNRGAGTSPGGTQPFEPGWNVRGRHAVYNLGLSPGGIQAAAPGSEPSCQGVGAARDAAYYGV